MTHTMLLEIGLEEIPAHVVTPSVQQLAERLKEFLQEQRLDFEKLQTYSTPRRLAVKISGLADQQPDVEEEAKGPAKKIALQADGSWSKAAIGFTRGQKMTPDDIYFKELKGTEYVYVKKFIAGKTAAEILPDLKKVVAAMNFPTMMRWGNNDFKYIRPIRWIVALLDQEVINFKLLNITTGRKTQGHRFLGHQIELSAATDYPQSLESVAVIADAAKRKTMIKNQIAKLAQEHDWKIVVEADLLEEVNNLVEYPTVFAGSFAEKYLQIPDEVLITSMRDHQRFFYVRDQQGKLLPYFVSVRNGNQQFLANVIAGNEKVLTARLEDAAFFYQEDQKTSLSQYVAKLEHVMFHDKIGTMAEKMQRVGYLSQSIAEQVGLNSAEQKDLQRAAAIYKFDLVTGMVGEFSELQGVMGEKYALLQGETPAVATAIREHYLPTEAGGKLPATKVGAVLAIADKLDSITDFFAAGMLPSGSNDPYALRRQAAGIIRICLEFDWPLAVKPLLALVASTAQQQPALYQKIQPAHVAEATEFMMDRMRKQLQLLQYPFDIITAVAAQPRNTFTTITQAAEVLQVHRQETDFKQTIEAASRVLRLTRKAKLPVGVKVQPALFENETEAKLNQAVATAKTTGTLEEDYQQLQKLREPIEAYFDQTMVMSPKQQLQQNRLAQLKQLAKLFQPFGDLTAINVK
ncbi:MAG: glycine--tRNA ligase subunit beta [Liquorilactobacillus nagelii]|jgi:glycyl-tRNA synthetase beta chain|uniref:glycine--tRNA ligase subunit beta n=1 Tax=Liquorilactobacillus nagelii TaxID=82688 RepID=UPI00242F7CB7|nr:glycine--tRNA ligase subunit beta [Liquorilactobacillus nagelii]MCI1632461.1 glycine--tRNA ligase subunit beta [Liquorilactobacillus nagelii]MCI1920577.1 glycine--tRNA ligase subunit beta [Liquorilactobacillus nagelii]MCI1976922.1 glycine--tRNA ligase subunit beta [Liquorilactobacillus nagelii]